MKPCDHLIIKDMISRLETDLMVLEEMQDRLDPENEKDFQEHVRIQDVMDGVGMYKDSLKELYKSAEE